MIEAQQKTDFEAEYISESFGIPFVTALKITQEKDEKAKAKKKRK